MTSRRTLAAVKRILLRESRVQPLLLVFEDLHWIDSETQAFLNSLVESLPAAPVLLAVNYRLEYQHAWGSKTYYRQLRIDPLPPESAEDLLAGLLGDDQTVAPLKPVLIQRTEGNPLFLEESVRTLVETGTLAGTRGAYRLVAGCRDRADASDRPGHPRRAYRSARARRQAPAPGGGRGRHRRHGAAPGGAPCAVADVVGDGSALGRRRPHGAGSGPLRPRPTRFAVKAERGFRTAIELARRRGERSLELRAGTSLARLWQHQGKGEDGRRLLADIYRWFTEGFDTADLTDSKRLLDELSAPPP